MTQGHGRRRYRKLRQDLAVALEADDSIEISKILSTISVAETAMLLDSLPAQQRNSIWPLVEPGDLGAVLLETQDDISDARLKLLDAEEIAAIVETLAEVDAGVVDTMSNRSQRVRPVTASISASAGANGS
jgi:Mg/Co/Ni transporter MgtE